MKSYQTPGVINPEIKCWAILNRNELLKSEYREFDASHILNFDDRTFEKLIWAPIELLSGRLTEKEFFECCKKALQTFGESIAQYSKGSGLDILKALYLTKALIRLKRIVQFIEHGYSIWDACAPYAVGNAYLNPQLFVEREAEIQKDFCSYVFDNFNSEVATRRMAYDQANISSYIAKHDPDPNLFIDLLSKILNNSKSVESNFMSFLSHLSQGSWCNFMRAMFNNREFITKLFQKNKFIDVLNTKTNTGLFLLQNMDILKTLSDNMDSTSFFNCIKKLSLDLAQVSEFNATQRAIFNSKSFFEILLMQNLDYTALVKVVISDISLFQNEARQLFYEAILRGDKNNASNLSQAYINYDITRKNLTEKNSYSIGFASLFSIKEENRLSSKSSTENTHYSASLGYHLQDFWNYMVNKYQITDNKDDLYFIKHPSDFLSLMQNLGLIKDTESFQKQMSETFNINFSSSLTPNSSDQSLLKRVEQLESENAKLKSQVASFQQELNLIKEQLGDFLGNKMDTSFRP